jgi:NAD(P)-dependent dehydrogenase (short-subunit alcohol dehydrogenase family)
MEGLLAGKSVVITGAGSGVGRAATLLFAQHGAKVLASDVDAAAVEDVAAEARAGGGEAAASLCDVSDDAQVRALVDMAVERYGRLDVMYNNAGVTRRMKTDFLDTTQDDLLKLTAINVGGVVSGIQAAVRQFRKQGGGGVIVNTASLAGLIGYGSPLYSSTKGAVTTLTRSTALQYAKENIRINSACPAAMMTNFGVSDGFVRTPENEAWSASMFPMGRNVEAMECAKVALFLASDLSSAMTGINVPVDCGLSVGIKV